MLSDDEFLKIVADERRNSIGFDNDDDLAAQREKALNYFKGEMSDVPALPNRSKAVSTDVSDAIETALPDLVEIFVGGDDVATFQATGPEDEEQAKAETEYVQHVIFEENPGFLTIYSMIKDALTCKIGVAKSWWEDESYTDEQRIPTASLTPEQVAVIAQTVAEGAEVEEDGDELVIRTTRNAGCQKNMAVPPEDFTFSRDTVVLRDAVYCAMRSRQRAQALIQDGYDADDVDRLPAYSENRDLATEQARDTVNESDNQGEGATRALRTVEIVEHYIRIDADGDGKTELWKVVTGGGETILLDKEQVASIPFSVITPYIVPHRLMGQSLADLLLEIQRIKTALLRMLLDSGYFALNQRLEVAMDQSNQWTIADLLRNEPGVPIRTKTGTAIRPVSAAGLNFDVTGALEYISTVAEQRTGIVRNAQGLNPDTLHDTADGARQLIAAAQKRVRMIARVFAETGIKDLFLNVHELLRANGYEVAARIGGQWSKVDPSKWPERKGLKVEIGVGSGGREHDIAAGNALGMMLQNAVTAQGGIDGPLTNAKGINAYAKRQTERLGFKDAEQYWTDPDKFAQEQAQKPPQDPPEVQKAKIEAQIKQQAAQQDAQLSATKMQQEHQLKTAHMQQEMQLKREQIAAEMDLKREELQAELQLKAQEMQANTAIRAAQAERGEARSDRETDANISSSVQPGGDPG